MQDHSEIIECVFNEIPVLTTGIFNNQFIGILFFLLMPVIQPWGQLPVNRFNTGPLSRISTCLPCLQLVNDSDNTVEENDK